MHSSILTGITADIQKYVYLTICNRTDIPEADAMRIAMKTAVEFQNQVNILEAECQPL